MFDKIFPCKEKKTFLWIDLFKAQTCFSVSPSLAQDPQWGPCGSGRKTKLLTVASQAVGSGPCMFPSLCSQHIFSTLCTPATLASLRQPWFMLCTFLGWSSFISLIFALGLTSLLWSSPCTLGSQGTANVSMEHLFQLHFCPLMSFFLWQDSPTSL